MPPRSSTSSPYAGGQFYGAPSCAGPYGTQSADLAFKTFFDAEGAFQPDGRIRVNFGAWTGGNVYNSTGDGQALSRQARRGEWVLFRISIQNDGLVRDRFTLDADGVSVASYRIRYFRGTREITAAVVAGTYRTPRLGPGRRVTIEAWVKPKWTAAQGSSVTRVVQISSVGDPTKVDAVRFTLQRK